MHDEQRMELCTRMRNGRHGRVGHVPGHLCHLVVRYAQRTTGVPQRRRWLAVPLVILLAACDADPGAAPAARHPTRTPRVIHLRAPPASTSTATATVPSPVAPTPLPSPTAIVLPTATTAPTPPVPTGTVITTANIRSHPRMQGSTVLGRVPAGATVTLRLRTPDGYWYAVGAPDGQLGWVGAALLQVDAAAATHVPTGTVAPAVP